MDGLATSLILETIKGAPGYFAVTIGFVSLIFALYLTVRKISITEITSIGKLQTDQITQLLNQIKQLSSELAEARTQISGMYDKINELEDVVRQYRNK